MNYAKSILEGKEVFATHITPTKEDRFECVECVLPVTYKRGSEKVSAHFAHPPGSWGVDCSLMVPRTDNKWRKGAKENYQSAMKLVKLKHITKKQALKVVKRVVEYVDEENKGWKNQHFKVTQELIEWKEKYVLVCYERDQLKAKTEENQSWRDVVIQERQEEIQRLKYLKKMDDRDHAMLHNFLTGAYL